MTVALTKTSSSITHAKTVLTSQQFKNYCAFGATIEVGATIEAGTTIEAGAKVAQRPPRSPQNLWARGQ